MYKLFALIITIIWPILSYGLVFELPKVGDNLVGDIKVTQVRSDEDFSDVAIRFDVGYYEIFEANPGIDPDKPTSDTVLVVPTRYILPSELKKNTIVINLTEMRLYYQPENENKVYIFPVGIGKEGWETPVGEMTIVSKTKNPTWVVPNSIYKFRESVGDKVNRTIPPGPDNPLGSYSLRLSHREYLIHGTNLPAGVGRRSTAGCVRLYEPDIETLYNLVNVGTKVIIINKPYKAGWLGRRLYLEAHMPLLEQRLAMGDDIKPALDVVTKAAKERSRNVAVNWKKVDIIAKEHLVMPRVVN